MTSPLDYPRLIEAAQKLGLRLEFVDGVGVWEHAPVPLHQAAVQQILGSITRGPWTRPPWSAGCACYALPDVDIDFPDGSRKRPDISIWSREPDELDTAVTLVPVAVVEVVSKGHEKKDVVGAEFYLRSGVQDVLVFNPYTRTVRHYVEGSSALYDAPATLNNLRCGCEVTFA
jgi:hypothetical protein